MHRSLCLVAACVSRANRVMVSIYPCCMLMAALCPLQVGDALLDVIFDPDVADGAGLVIDGFPRTALQARHIIQCYDLPSIQQLLRV